MKNTGFFDAVTVYKNPGGNCYLLDLQANVNSHFTTRVVAPLLPIEDVPHYASSLNPVFEKEDTRVVMATQDMASVPSLILKHAVATLEHHGKVAALDLLFQGF